MTTLFHPDHLVKSSTFGRGIIPPAGAAPVILTIKAVRYEVAAIDPGEDATAAVRLVKLAGKGEVYDVQRDRFGLVTCDCPHYEMRLRGNTMSMCKHGVACVEAGLIVAPGPAEPAPDTYHDEAPELDVSAYHEPEPADDGSTTPTVAGGFYREYTMSDLAELAELNALPAISGGAPQDADSWGPETDAWRWAISPDGVDVDDTDAFFATFRPDGDTMTAEEVYYDARPDAHGPRPVGEVLDAVGDRLAGLQAALDQLSGPEAHRYGCGLLGHPADA